MILLVYSFNIASTDDPINKILADMPDPVSSGQEFIDLDDQIPTPRRLPANVPWVDILNVAKDELNGVDAVFLSWRVKQRARLTLVTLRL